MSPLALSLPPVDIAESSDAEQTRAGSARRHQPLPPRRAVADALTGGAFVVAATALAVFADAERTLEVGPAAALVVMFACGFRVRIDVGVSYTAPVQLAFVPMLLLLPTPAVPLLVLLAWFLGRLPDLRGADAIHPDRLLLIPADCWFSLGPALVLIAGDAQIPDWDKWPVYLLALVAQFGLELFVSHIREWIGEGVPPRLVVRELVLVWAIDALLSPLGLLAAFASTTFTYAFLLVVPLAGLLGLYAREREQRIGNAIELLKAGQDREALIAGASHELVTPLGVLVGLTSRLVHGGELTRERRDQLDTVMRREVIALRHVVRQFVDYTRLKTERDLQLRPAPTRMEDVAAEIVVALTGLGRVGVTAAESLSPAQVDPDRAHQMVMSLVAEALEGTDAVQLELGLDEAGEWLQIVVTSPQPLRERPFAEGGEGSNAGLGLYVTRELARRQGGDLVALAQPGGARYVLSLPLASPADV